MVSTLHRGQPAAMVLLVTLVMTATAPSHAAAARAVAGQLVFARVDAPGLFAVGADGRDARRLTTRHDEDPAWSPDGRRLAFVRMRGDGRGYGLYVATASGAGARALTRGGGYAQAPAWSPDGSRIVFAASGGRFGTSKDPSCAPNLWVVRPDGSGLRRLLRRGVQPALSPDGQRLAFVRPDADGREWLYVADSSGRGVRRIGRGSHPSWSPDGRRLVVVRTVGANRMADLWRVRARDGRAIRLTRTTALSEVDPAWSPDGRWIAFAMTRDDRQDVFVLPARVGPPKAVTTGRGAAAAQEPAWRPTR